MTTSLVRKPSSEILRRETVFTHFWDMHSGGGTKEGRFDHIFIEAPEDEAKVIFYNRFGHNPDRVTCTCCGADYIISESKSLLEATAYHRGCQYIEPIPHKLLAAEAGVEGLDGLKAVNRAGRYLEPDEDMPFGYKVSSLSYPREQQTIEEYAGRNDVLIIFASDIKPEEREGALPMQGYVWMG